MTAHKDTPPEGSEPPVSSKPRMTSKGFIFVVLLVAGCIVAATVLMEMQAHLTSLQTSLLSMKTQQETTIANLNTMLQRLHADGEKRDVLDKQMNTVLHQQRYLANDWVLLKARNYLELAQTNTYWHYETQETSALLRQADALLADMHEQPALDIRRAIAEENAQVLAIEKIDTTGLLNQLNALQQIVQSLLVKQVPVLLDNQQQAPKVPSSWHDRLQDSLGVLKKLVVIRRDDAEIKPWVTPAYAALLRENIQLILQETQFAVLQGNETLYQLTLKQAVTKITQYFDGHESNTVAVLKQLSGLMQQSVVQKKPDIGRALVLLNQWIDSKQDGVPLGAPSS